MREGWKRLRKHFFIKNFQFQNSICHPNIGFACVWLIRLSSRIGVELSWVLILCVWLKMNNLDWKLVVVVVVVVGVEAEIGDLRMKLKTQTQILRFHITGQGWNIFFFFFQFIWKNVKNLTHSYVYVYNNIKVDNFVSGQNYKEILKTWLPIYFSLFFPLKYSFLGWNQLTVFKFIL